MQVINVADLRGPGILPGDAGRVGLGRPELLPDLLGLSSRPMVFPRLLDILAWPSRPVIRLASVRIGWGSGKKASPRPNSAFHFRAISRVSSRC